MKLWTGYSFFGLDMEALGLVGLGDRDRKYQYAGEGSRVAADTGA